MEMEEHQWLGLNGRGGGGSAVSGEQAAFVSLQRCHLQGSLSCARLRSAPFQLRLLSALLLSVHTLCIFALCFL